MKRLNLGRKPERYKSIRYLGVWCAAVVLAAAVGCADDEETDNQGAAVSKTFQVQVANVASAKTFFASGAFDTPMGATGAAPIGPGQAYEVSFVAPPGSALSLATMFVPSNDFFYAPDEMGIPLYGTDGSPRSGDMTAMIQLWDAGTEVNQEPGLGMDQAQRQSGPNTGAADADTTVRLAPDTFGNLPAAADVLRVTLTPGMDQRFTLRLQNVSTSTTLATSDNNTQAVPLAPGVWVVHSDASPLFTRAMANGGQGLEALAEDGDPSGLAGRLATDSGLTGVLSPGAWAVHTSEGPLFMSAMADRGEGLEALAEDGDPTMLEMAVEVKSGVSSSGVFNTPEGDAQPGPAGPGKTYTFAITARPGDRLSLATMFVQSNDLFYAPDPMGIALFDASGQPRSGDVTAMVQLWDAGTEKNQPPGAGPDQAPRQSAANTGEAESTPVAPVDDGFTYPATSDVLRVTVTPGN